ncbi:MAG: tRNA (guanosine(37)-N1)-methyltransferase TrmD [Candidatus Omnitrophica bacterium]|nr:tRNA (guanosine(37)-N1)-methyltransferase TrmD [Candidatus Omnitrophota bacterium]
MKHPRLEIDILTLFPKLVAGPMDESMIKQAKKRGQVQIRVHNLRDYALDRHKSCDGRPYGGGAGMVMMTQPIFDCLQKIGKGGWRILVSPRGKVFRQSMAKRLARKRHLIFICGRYEGVDERVHQYLVDEEISIGDFVTTGGELPALCLMDAVIRWVPGVLGNKDSLKSESFINGLLDFPQYTRPRDFRGWKVPKVLFSGNHREVEWWRAKAAMRLTKRLRPDLLSKQPQS